MTDGERKFEFLQYLKNDIDIAIQESKENPVNYLLDRALDPLDPLREVYRCILQDLGAEITDNRIKLPKYLQIQMENTPVTPSPDTSHTDSHGNYHITDADLIGTGGKVAKFEANLTAITLLKQLDSEKRYATPSEQPVLVKYTGWGGLSEVFKSELEGPWLERQNALKTVFSPEEYASASRSTLNAHYTDPAVIDAVWSAAIRMGYNGGPTLEPATGIGHFFGKRPAHLPIEMHGIEIDPISGRIAQQLYQSADIKITGFENIKMPESQYNLIISNVPFGDYKPYEEKRVQTPGLDNRYSIHDFYFLKSLHGIREGGLVAFITSRYTMDKHDSDVRKKIAEKADFVGAIRLPNNAFTQIANTEVVTDIVFLQKRPPEKPMSDLTRSFINTSSISIPSSDEEQIEHSINRYYIDYPDMVCGTHSVTGTMYSQNEYTVAPSGDNLSQQINTALQNLPENILNVIVDKKTLLLNDSIRKAVSHVNSEEIPAGGYIVGSDDRLYQKNFETRVIELSPLYKNETDKSEEISRIIRMSAIRDSVKTAINHHYSGQELDTVQDLEHLNSLYDNFVKDYGYLNTRKNLYAFNDDPDCSLLQSLELWNPKKKIAQKADIFKGITFARKEVPTSVESPVDAMVLSLSRYGKLDMSYMESLTGTERNVLVDNLLLSGHVYQDPYDFLHNNRTTYLTADEYLSGNIRDKITLARRAEETAPLIFSRNVQELERILPREIGPEDISIRLNSPILGEENVKSFLRELLDIYDDDLIRIIHIPITGKWDIRVNFNGYYSAENHETYGTDRMSAVEIVNAQMNGKPIKVFDRGKDDALILNAEATAAAELKAEAISNAFLKWVWRDPARTEDIVKRYNITYNSCVERTFTHPERLQDSKAEIWMHGCAFPHPLRSNQADSIWRVLQSGNTMLAHTVGSGKTLEMACSSMELRRLGIRNKPMIVCPDHMIGQWSAEFREAYPAAKFLVADDHNWDQNNRRAFINRIATGDWDAILIRSESFKMIPMSEEYQAGFFKKRIDEYKYYLRIMDMKKKKTRSVKNLEKAIEKYENKIKELTDAQRDEGVIPFDKLGIDHLFIDEADIYKNLEYFTQLQNVRGLGTPKGSERAMDILMKIRYIQDINGGITFATGTPISNTLVEAYTMQRFLQPEVLKANGLEAFDEWARQYAECVTQMELNNTGTGYTPVTRFSKIVNVPELVSSLRQVWDIQTAQNLEDAGILVPGVNLPYMLTINEAAPSTPLLKSYLKHLEYREQNLRGKPEKGQDNVLSIMTDGRKAAIDMRFIHPSFPDDPDSKLNLGVRKIFDVYSRFKEERYTCAVFFDKARSMDRYGNVLFDGINDMKEKLIKLGISPNEIGDVRSCKTSSKRLELFRRVRDGECRVIFGSTINMGAGTNYQKLLKAVVHIDAPWRPRDIEQQNGRGYRPGNSTGELWVYNLVTKGSLDTGLWNVLETKANSIRQVMDGSDKTTRQIEENYYGSVKDLSIDNELMKEAVELDHAVRKLRTFEKSFNSDIAHANRRLHSLPGEIENAQSHSEKILADMNSRLPEAKGDKFSITVFGNVYTDRKEVGERIKKEISTLSLQAKATGRDVEKPIGSYSGLSLSLKAHVRDSDYLGRIIAHGQNFEYSADIRLESVPAKLCVTLHSKIYNHMDKKYEESLSNIESLNRVIENYKTTASAVFPKADELREKEARYLEVMGKLKELSEKNPVQEENSKEFPWKYLPVMKSDEVQEAVRVFMENNPVIEQQSPTLSLKTGAEIAEAVKGSHGITLPGSVVTTIDKAITEGKLQPEATFKLISETIDRVKSAGFSWKSENVPAGVHSAFVIDQNTISPDDIIIKPTVTGDKKVFDAFKIIDQNSSKFLGSEPTVDLLRNRVEAYVACLQVRDTINETINLTSAKNVVRENRVEYGIGL